MRRRILSIIAVLAAWYFSTGSVQAAESDIITDNLAARHGLTRAWMTQVEMDVARSRLKDLVLYDGILYAQTDRAMVHAIDAETGATLWAKQIGRPEHPSMTPGVGHDLLAIINGSRLYVANRFDGKILLETDIDGAPGAGPAVSDQRVLCAHGNGSAAGLSHRTTCRSVERSKQGKSPLARGFSQATNSG